MLKRFFHECDGQSLVEYGLLVAGIIVGTAAVLITFQGAIADVWEKISTNLAGE